MGTTSRSLLGLGLYSIPEAAHLLRLPAAKLRGWAKGYTYYRAGQGTYSSAVIDRELADLRDGRGQPLLTFRDLVELNFVAAFRGHGVSMPMIRKAASAAAEMFGSDHPFATGQFATDGRRIYAVFEPGGPADGRRYVNQLGDYQYVFESIIVPFFRKLDIEDDHATRYWPRGHERFVVMDARRCFGKPIDPGSGVRTFVLYQASVSGDPIKGIADWYEVSERAVEDAIEFERWLAA
jgi:uncharacterized protein (DUF433 family)